MKTKLISRLAIASLMMASALFASAQHVVIDDSLELATAADHSTPQSTSTGSALASDFSHDMQSTELNAAMDYCMPNPVQSSCMVRYYVPEDATQAMFYLRNAQGKIVDMSNNLSQGHGQYQFQTEALPSGNYYYTLTVDYAQIDTRTMIVK